MEPVTSILKDMGADKAFPTAVARHGYREWRSLAIPSNIHRGNVLFYNKKVFTDNGLKAPTTWDVVRDRC